MLGTLHDTFVSAGRKLLAMVKAPLRAKVWSRHGRQLSVWYSDRPASDALTPDLFGPTASCPICSKEHLHAGLGLAAQFCGLGDRIIAEQHGEVEGVGHDQPVEVRGGQHRVVEL
jgi:hypothetical protein